MEADRNPAVENHLGALHRAFLGKVLATFSHEVKNHLAIIKEYSGLVHDLIEIGKVPNKDDNGQYLAALRSIHQQIDKSTSVITFFNKFCHRMDAPVSAFRIQDALQELLVLIHRLAHQKRVSFETDFATVIPEVLNNPSMVQMILFCMFESVAGRLGDSGTILWRIRAADKEISVVAEPRGGSGIAPASAGRVCPEDTGRDAAHSLGIRLSTTGESIILTLPVHTS